jgi:hypothetical protein
MTTSTPIFDGLAEEFGTVRQNADEMSAPVDRPAGTDEHEAPLRGRLE